MNEVFFILFLLSGAIKPFLTYFHIPTGIDFTLLSAFILSGLLMKNLIHHQLLIRLDKVMLYSIVLLISFFALILFSFFYTSSQHYVYTKTLQFFTILLGFVFPFFIQSFSIQTFFKSFVIIVILLTLVFLPVFLPAYKLLMTNYTAFKISPLYAIYQSYLTMGYLIAIALIIATLTPAFTQTRRALIFLFLFGALLTTGARGPLFAFIIISLMYLFYKAAKMQLKKPNLRIVLMIAVVAGVIGTYAVVKMDISGLLERTYNRITTIEKDTSANDRLVRAEFVLKKIDTDHFIFGYGFGSFGYEYTKVDERSYPHNMILEILFELGAIGILIYGLLIAVILKRLIDTREFVPWALFLFLFLNSLKSLSLSDSRILFGFFAILILYTSHQKTLQKDLHV
jgi:O-antigen ligase